MSTRVPPRGPDAAVPTRPTVAARLVTSAPEGVLRLDFSPPPSGTWTLVRAELARRLAERAVSQAATVSDADLTAFAVGRGLPATDSHPTPAAWTAAPATARAMLPDHHSPNLARGRAAILHRSDMLTGDELADCLGVSRATVALRRAAGRLLALESGTKRGYRYPAWQADIVADPERSALFGSVLQMIGPRGSWSAFHFFTDPSPALAGRTPLDVLASGEFDAMRSAIAQLAERPDGA